MFSYIFKGGILMIPIILCGIFATFIIIERIFYFYVTKKRDAKLLFELKSLLSTKDYENAAALCEETETPTSKVIRKVIDCRKFDERDLKDLVESEIDMQIPLLEHFLTPLGTISNIATLLGLLGTVTGNIKAFSVLGNTGAMGDPQALAGAIGEALITTVAGLIVSIPSLIFYNYFNSRVNRKINELENVATSVILKVTGKDY